MGHQALLYRPDDSTMNTVHNQLLVMVGASNTPSPEYRLSGLCNAALERAKPDRQNPRSSVLDLVMQL